MKKYEHLAEMVWNQPWLILESKLAQITEILSERIAGDADAIERRISDFRAAQVMTRKQPAPAPVIIGGVGVLPVQGVLAPRMNMMMEISGGTSTEQLRASLAELVANPAVKTILLDIDSPGGAVTGTPETAAAIAAARQVKPVVASVNAMAASAAYWLASQCSEICATPSGAAGSIGVIMVHREYSAADQMGGVKTTVISSGKFKAAGNPYEPLTEDARAHLQAQSDEIYRSFVADVAAGRRVSEQTVREGFGQGGVVLARQALEMGMVDRLETFPETLARLLRQTGREPGAARAGIQTIRDFEAFLRDEGGFSNAAAKRIAAGGFKAGEAGSEPAPSPAAETPRDGAATDAPKASDGRAEAREDGFAQALRSYVASIRNP